MMDMDYHDICFIKPKDKKTMMQTCCNPDDYTVILHFSNSIKEELLKQTGCHMRISARMIETAFFFHRNKEMKRD